MPASDLEPQRPMPLLGLHIRDRACAELTRAIALLGWRGSRVHEGIHQGRKSLRRTRAAIALGRSVLGAGAMLIDREIQHVNHRLSRWRDGQALVEAIGHLSDSDVQVAPMLRRARSAAIRVRAGHGRAAMAADSSLPAIRELLTTLLAALRSLRWDAVDATVVNDALTTSRALIQSAASKACQDGKAIEWHRLRRRVRRLAQQYGILEGSSAGDLALPDPETVARTRKLARKLGEAQDHALICEHCGARSTFPDDYRKTLRTAADEEMKRMHLAVAELIGNPDVAVANAGF